MKHCCCLTEKSPQIQSLYVICMKDLRSKDSRPKTQNIKFRVEARGLFYISVFFGNLSSSEEDLLFYGTPIWD